MKIVFVTETWRPHIDGVVTRLDATISRLVERGHEVLVIAPTRGADIPGVQQLVIRHALIPIIDRKRPWALPDRRITAMIEKFDPDLVHLVSPVLMGVVALRRLAGRYAVVASFHTDVAAYASRYGLASLRPLLDRLVRLTYQRADVRLATSPTGRQRLADVGVPSESIRIWPPAVADVFCSATATPTGDPVAAPTTTAIGEAPERTPSVLYVGRLAREKSCDRLCPVARLAAAVDPDWRLTFVGDGPDRARLQRMFAGTATSFAGVRRGAELIAMYQRADVVAFPSTTDTVGLVLLEAAALGVPVVAIDTRASRDALGGYPRAVFVPPDGTAACWLAAFRQAAASPAPAYADRADWGRPRSWDEATDALLESYDLALSRSGVAPRRLVVAH